MSEFCHGLELLSGRALPAPVVTDQTAMAIRSGVAFVRVFGAALLGVVAALWASKFPTYASCRRFSSSVLYSPG